MIEEMTMVPERHTVESHAALHADHHLWQSEIEKRQGDLVLWQAEIHHLLEGVRQWQTTLEGHQNALLKHVEGLNSHQRAIGQHERLIAQFEQSHAGKERIGIEGEHQTQREQHQIRKMCYEAIKGWHRAIVSEWERLRRVIFGLSSLSWVLEDPAPSPLSGIHPSGPLTSCDESGFQNERSLQSSPHI